MSSCPIERLQKVVVDEASSKWISVGYGVPRRNSVLGPRQFFLFISEIIDLVKNIYINGEKKSILINLY